VHESGTSQREHENGGQARSHGGKAEDDMEPGEERSAVAPLDSGSFDVHGNLLQSDAEPEHCQHDRWDGTSQFDGRCGYEDGWDRRRCAESGHPGRTKPWHESARERQPDEGSRGRYG